LGAAANAEEKQHPTLPVSHMGERTTKIYSKKLTPSQIMNFFYPFSNNHLLLYIDIGWGIITTSISIQFKLSILKQQ
jgi:hypothetical protein